MIFKYVVINLRPGSAWPKREIISRGTPWRCWTLGSPAVPAELAVWAEIKHVVFHPPVLEPSVFSVIRHCQLFRERMVFANDAIQFPDCTVHIGLA